jgi:predicted nucleic acid-binding protein
MAKVVISDAGPLIALAKVDQLAILEALFGSVVIPDAVERECLSDSKEGSKRIQAAIDNGILVPDAPTAGTAEIKLQRSLGDGEKQAIRLALESSGSLLIIDDRLARKQALALNLQIAGLVRILSIAEDMQFIDSAERLIEEIRKNGYRISLDILKQIQQGK